MKIFETMEELRKYASENYIENGDIFTVKKPSIKSNPFYKRLVKLTDSIKLSTDDIKISNERKGF